jgi:hypothetical protein
MHQKANIKGYAPAVGFFRSYQKAVIVDGARGFYFGSNFEGCKRFWGD